MKKSPPVSCMCCTHGRPHLLEEAVESFLRQDYRGRKELVILNDLAEQELIFKHRQVRVINIKKSFRNLAEKRNACAALCTYDWLFLWDDDGIHLPWRLSWSMEMIEANRPFFKPDRSFILSNDGLSESAENLCHTSACFHRDLFNRIGGYSHMETGQDLEFENTVAEMLPVPNLGFVGSPREKLFYIYRYGGTDAHDASCLDGEADTDPRGGDHETDALGQRPYGDIVLKPNWKIDYVGMVARHLDVDTHPSLRKSGLRSLAAHLRTLGDGRANILRAFKKSSHRMVNSNVRVLAFTCSQHRPLMLRHCIMQIQRQTFPVDHAIFVNSSEESEPQRTPLQYQKIIKDLQQTSKHRLLVGYGRSKTHHENYTSALSLVDTNNYDLFLQIDDDDIYMNRYVEHVVADYISHGWDFSGTYSDGLLNGHWWHPNKRLQDLGLGNEDHELGIPRFMPPTTAFSRRAISKILEMPPPDGFEDIAWRRMFARDPSMILATRRHGDFIYNIHGLNVSTASWLER